MRIIARSHLKTFWERHKDAEQPLKAWFAEARKAGWRNPNEIKEQFASASVLQNQRIVFNIAGNKYRLVIRINYGTQIAYIRFIGTHDEYDKVHAEEI